MEKTKFTTISEYVDSLRGIEKEMMLYFIKYMRINHPNIEEALSFQMPTYKLGIGKNRNYIAFCANKNHFSMHSLDFEYISELKGHLSKPGKGKGCVNVPYQNAVERDMLIDSIETIIQRHNLRVKDSNII